MKIQHFMALVVLSLATVPGARAATSTWTGADPSGNWSAPANWSPAAVPTNGNDLVFPGGLPPGDMVSTNDLTDRIFRSITFSGASSHTIRGNPITLTNRTDCIINSGTNVIACDLTFSGTPATPDYQSPTIRGSGGSAELTVIGNVGGGSLYFLEEQFGAKARLVIRGQFTGGSVRVSYATLALYGDNPYAVSAEVRYSQLLVQGLQPNLNIMLFSDPFTTLTWGSLRGDGQVGDVTGYGYIILDSTLSAKNVSAYYLNINLNGTNVGEYGRLVASGDASPSSGYFIPSAGFNPQPGQVFTIVEKTSPGPITNAIFGPEGSITTLNGMPFRISYVGGGGNDVTLTVVTPIPIVLSGMQRSFDTQSVFYYSADVGLRYAVDRSATLSNWTTILTDTANTNPMTVTDFATNQMNFYRVRRLPNP